MDSVEATGRHGDDPICRWEASLHCIHRCTIVGRKITGELVKIAALPVILVKASIAFSHPATFAEQLMKLLG